MASERTRQAYRKAVRALTELASSRSVDIRGDKEAQVEATDAVRLALAALAVLNGDRGGHTTYEVSRKTDEKGNVITEAHAVKPPRAPYKVREAARVVVGASPRLDLDAEPIRRVGEMMRPALETSRSWPTLEKECPFPDHVLAEAEILRAMLASGIDLAFGTIEPQELASLLALAPNEDAETGDAETGLIADLLLATRALGTAPSESRYVVQQRVDSAINGPRRRAKKT